MTRSPCLIKAWLASPLAGEAPMLDAILERHAFIHNINGCAALSAGRQLNSHDPITYDMLDCVPLAQQLFACGEKCYCVSSPIVDGVCETTEHFVRRADYATLKGRIKPTEIAKLRQTTGPYAPSFEPHRVRTVRAIAWYARGDVPLLKDWLSHIGHIGGKTAAGYGIVDRWEVEELGASMFDAWYLQDGVLMRPVPIAVFNEAPKGAKPYFGAIKPPYWHPMRQMEIWKPC